VSAEKTYTRGELCDSAGVTPRTLYYYIQQDLLPRPGARGRGTRYEHRHLKRLQLIRLLQAGGHSLAEIRERLATLSDAQVEREVTRVSRVAAAPAREQPPAPDRSQWERVVLARDVEVHVRRPLALERGRRVERILNAARRILKDGER
jgi:DNA-binding transcriptional MerR regulator